ncbi:MAG: sulfotransferase domain-containing protein [Pseudomonadota bacterium]
MTGAFLVNASRSGSTMMSTMLAQHPTIASLSEFLATQGARALLPGAISGAEYWRQLAQPTSVMRRLANPDASPSEFLYHKVAGGRHDPWDCPPLLAVTLPHLFDDPDAVFADLERIVCTWPAQTRDVHHAALFEHLCALKGRQSWVERSGGALFSIAALRDAFPKAKIVVLLRDGRDVALSMRDHLPSRFMIWVWKRALGLGIDPFAPSRQIGTSRWIALAERFGGHFVPMERIMRTRPALADCAAYWSAMTTHGLDALAKTPDQEKLILHYEDLVSAPRTELSRLMSFLDAPCPEDWLQAASGVPKERRSKFLDLSPTQKAGLNDATAQVRARLG